MGFLQVEKVVAGWGIISSSYDAKINGGELYFSIFEKPCRDKYKWIGTVGYLQRIVFQATLSLYF